MADQRRRPAAAGRKAPGTPKTAPAARPRRRRWIWPAARWLLVAAIWTSLAGGVLIVWYAADLPDVEEAVTATRRPSIRVLAADGTELASAGDLFGVPVQVAELPPALPWAVMAIEDRRFYKHAGIDPWGLARAVVVNVSAGGIVQGGSTITQQVAKNLFLTHARTVKRKVQELMLALWLEHRFTKDQILSLYLNRAYFGAGTYGVDAAARKYFGVPASRVSTYQAAMLAGLLRAPSRYNPRANPDLADGRARQVLNSMVDAGFMTAAEAAAAIRNKGSVAGAVGPRTGNRWFVDWVLDQVPDYVSARDRDLVVNTTLDPHLQAVAERQVRAMLAGEGSKKRASQAALVAVTPGGAVRAMVGGRDYRASQYNRAVQALRQPGSAFKPFVYLAALEAGWTPESRVVDAPISVGNWRPHNFSNTYRGETTLAEALARSINTVAVRVSESVGRRRVAETARRLGVTAPVAADASVALGTAEVSLLDLTAAYAVFANGGLAAWPYAVTAIRDGDGNVLYRRQGRGGGRVVAPEDAAAMNRMLAGTVQYGTARAAALDRPVAGKTGTSQEFRDAWFIGYTADLVAGVWMGNDDSTPMKKVTGGSLPARVWHGFMSEASAGRPVRPLFDGRTVVAAPADDRDEPSMPRAAPVAEERNLFQQLLDSLADSRG